VEGRRQEFSAFPEFSSAEAVARIPAPQSASTFRASQLRWEELEAEGHASILRLHRALLRLRRERAALRGSDTRTCSAAALDDSTVAFTREAGGDSLLVVARLLGEGAVSVPALRGGQYDRLLDTEDPSFAVDPHPLSLDAAAGSIAFDRPGAVVFTASRH
jgi:maltooligosyltrehalose trehalohydrolase